MTHILMIAAENGALPGGKAGGIGDVVRDIPKALAKRNCTVSVVTPAYGSLNQLADSKLIHSFSLNFAGKSQTLRLYRLNQKGPRDRVRHYVIDHPLFSYCGKGKIYCDDPPGRPFSTDANKFALFCQAVGEAIVRKHFGKLHVLHLHDWHAAFLLVLRAYSPRFRSLKKIHCAFTIHNLALQGVRPFKDDESSLEDWFPELKYKPETLADPEWSHCINPMATAIRLADTVHAVSPNYAREILKPSDIEQGRYGGERLENELIRANREERLFGILNGCDYAASSEAEIRDWAELLELMQTLNWRWCSKKSTLGSAHFLAYHSLNQLSKNRPKTIITSVGRITSQKIELMRQPTSSGQPALHAALDLVGSDSLILVLGSGDPIYEQFLCETMVSYANFVFLNGFSEVLAEAFYQQGDLFFMPSSFEPCGISQMLAMRDGQPCLVHDVGGLSDTVIHNQTGFVFSGKNPTKQVDSMLLNLKQALKLQRSQSTEWLSIQAAAAAARFEWGDSIDAYLIELYQLPQA